MASLRHLPVPLPGHPSQGTAWGNVLIQGPGVREGALTGSCMPDFLWDHLSRSQF